MLKLIPFLFLIGCAVVPVKPNNPISLVFKVEVYKNGILEGNGTGFVAKIDNDTTYVITNKHVCHEGADYILIDYNFGHYSAQYYKVHNTADLCLLKTSGAFKATPVFANPKYGEHITAIGAPHGAFPVINDGFVKQPVIFNSIIHGIHYYFYGNYVNLSVEEGSSGSPVFNDQNEIVGVIFATIDGNLSCIVPGLIVRDFIRFN